MRKLNTTASGGSFDSSVESAVWNKGVVVSGHDSSVERKDTCGAWMRRTSYGTTGQYGWEIDHIIPVAKGGTDVMSNLQPLQWENNRHKADMSPGSWDCAVVAR